MLKDAVQEWFEQGRVQGIELGRAQGIELGRAQGIELGIERGCQEERTLLCRQAARKFGGDASERLATDLADVTDPDRLAQVGDWIIECATAPELIARVDEVFGPLAQLKEICATLEDTVERWIALGRVEGIKQGRIEGIELGCVEGIEQGIEQARTRERARLCRQAARKFGGDASERLATELAGVTDPDRLGQVGDWIIECATVAELVVRVVDEGRLNAE